MKLSWGFRCKLLLVRLVLLKVCTFQSVTVRRVSRLCYF